MDERLKKISKTFSGTKERYCILNHKSSRRMIIFKNTNSAIEFIKPKFKSKLKTLIYILIRLKLLQIFLPKLNLSSKIGDVIFIANTIKCFNIKERVVTSYPISEKHKDDFILQEKYRLEISKEGFAPEIYEINEDKIFSKEELLDIYEGGDTVGVFTRLNEWKDLKKSNGHLVRCHGSFSPEQVVVKDGKYYFIDWNREYKNKLNYDYIDYINNFER